MLQGRTRKDGITLIALIVTIVILLILSTVTVMEVRETALFEKSRTAARDYKEAQEKEIKQMETVVEKVDEWAKDRTEITNDLQIGDYVIYNVQYTDARRPKTNFTENNGWRVLDPGKKYSDKTYDGVKIISTGSPVKLYYDDDKIMDAEGENYAWKGTEAEVAVYKKKIPYYSIKSDKGVTAAAGLSNPRKFADIKVVDKTGASYDNGKACREKIEHENGMISGETSLENLVVLKDMAEKVECPTLEIVKETMMKRKNKGGREFIIDRPTDEDVKGDPNYKYKTKDDAAKGFWNLQDLGIGEYQPGENEDGWSYWIASPHSDSGISLRRMNYSGTDGYFHNGCGWYDGLRPIVSLKSNIKLQKSEFQGN